MNLLLKSPAALWGASRPYVRPAGAVFAGLLALALLAHARESPYAMTLVWSGLLLASFVGWGSVANFWLSRGHWVDWGLRAGWGMTLFVLTGGYLCLVHAAFRRVLIVQVGLGDVAFLATLAVRPLPKLSRRRLTVWTSSVGIIALVAGAYALAVFTLFGTMGDQSFNPSDDAPLYFTLPTRLLETSSLFEPFCARRITTFGGQIYLHASFLTVAPMSYMNELDTGISPLLIVGLLVGIACEGVRPGLKARHAVPLGLSLLLFFSLQSVRANVGSLLTSIVALLTLYRTLRVPMGTRGDSGRWPPEPRRLIALAATTVACIVLRTSVAAAVLPFVVLALASDLVLDNRGVRVGAMLVSAGRVSAVFAAACLVALAPWSIMMHQSVGSFFVPFGHLNVTQGWGFLIPAKSWDETAKHLLDLLFWDSPISIYLPFALAGLVPLTGRRRNDTVALTIAAFIGVATLARTANGFNERDSSRYFYAYSVTMALVAAASVRVTDMRAALVAVGLGMHLVTSRDGLHKSMGELVRLARKGYDERATAATDFASRTGDYRDLQLRVPAGATIAAAVHEGWQFDFQRNTIYSLDVLGGMGPKPGWPAYQGPRALSDYLMSNGVRYLIWVDFNIPSDFYNRDHWRTFLTWEGSYLQGEARLQLDAEDAIEKLTTMRRVVYRDHGMTLVDLASPP